MFVKLLKERMADKSKLKEVKRFFKFLDTNKDGKIDASELIAFVSKLGISHSKTKVEAAFKVYDTNKDGFIDAREFAEFIVLHENVRLAIHALLMLTQDCPCKKAFEYFDSDHNGKITVPELVEISKKLKVNWNEEKATKVLTALNPMGVPEVADDLFYGILKVRLECPCAEKDLLEAFKFIDSDHNGYLTPKEVVDFMTLLLNDKAISYEQVISAIYKYDTNGDLKISPCEFMALVNGNQKVKIGLQALLMFMTAGNKCCDK
jgi:calcium-binding protein CML